MLAFDFGILDEALAVEHQARVEAADARDAADHLTTDGREHLPEEALVAEAGEDLGCVVRLPVIDGQEARELGG